MRNRQMKQIREVRLRDIRTYFFLPIVVLACIWTAFGILLVVRPFAVPTWAYVAVAVALSYWPIRFSAMGAVLVYKAFAPLSVRDACRFTPTCSTYMLLAIKKYGLIVGITKGILRICRCKPPNGGEDWP